MAAVGILGIGAYLPEQVRRNDWWPEEVVAKWRARAAESLVRHEPDSPQPPSEGVRRILAAMAELKDDPFQGTRERRLMTRGMTSSDLEVEAVKDALARSGTPPGRVGLLLTDSQLPDYLGVANAPLVHRKLGLPAGCLAFGTVAACNFLTQLHVAAPLVASGTVEVALLVQSSGYAHLAQMQDAHSPWFGDGATAVVVGRVADGFGVLSEAHRTNGEFFEALVVGCPGSTWHSNLDRGVALYVQNHQAARKMLLAIADHVKEVVGEALARAGLSAGQIDFYATHQATAWFRRATQEYLGLSRARSFDTFGWTGSLAGANVPFSLAMAEREGMLRAGDLVASFSGGSGVTYSSAIFRWGTA